jgi:hypothetical protein
VSIGGVGLLEALGLCSLIRELVVEKKAWSDGYLSLGDTDIGRIAIRNGAWYINSDSSLDVEIWRGLPFEYVETLQYGIQLTTLGSSSSFSSLPIW